MNTISFEVPKGIEITEDLIKRCQLAVLPELAESHALSICKKHFGVEFKLGKYNSKGFDLISLDGSIVIEVKQTSKPHSEAHVYLQVCSTWPKHGICTHMLILDYYNSPNRCSIIPHDEFFESTFHGATGMWRWDIDYGDRMRGNTRLFKKHEVEL